MYKRSNIFLFIIFSALSITLLFSVSFKLWEPLNSSDYLTILIYLFLLVFVNSFPLIIGEIFVTFMFAVSISVFLEFGIVMEMLLTQISILVSMLVSAQKRPISRIALSQMMFIWVSVVSGFAYFFAGGTVGFTISNVNSNFIPIIIYSISYFIVNHILIYIIRYFMTGKVVSLISDDAIWDAATLLLTVPLGIIMYLVKITYGIYGMVFVALPIVITTHLFKIYSELHHSHLQLQSLNKVSASFTSELNLDKTINALQQAIRELFIFDYSYIFLTKSDRLKPISVENYQGEPLSQELMDKLKISLGEGLSGRVALFKKAQIVDNDADLYQLNDEPEFIKYNKSLLSVPLIWHNQIIGVITLGSLNEYHFSKRDMTVAKILASQAAVAIQNAATYQKTEEKSLLDELTGLYNFRAFNDLLNEKLLDADVKEESLSLLMIDLDHFKKLNDRNGHHAGNEVLKEIAKLFKRMTRQEDVVARYGGEEFVIIIPNCDAIKARAISERIRLAIQDTVVRVKGNLSSGEYVEVSVTASIGVTVYPDKGESAQDLIRNADRAMYIGSKQAGRNKVSIYE